MTGHTTQRAPLARATGAPLALPVENEESSVERAPMLTGRLHAPRTDADRLRDIAAVLRHEAAALATILPTGQTDVRADIALLRMVADNIDGYATTREAA